MEKAIMFLLFFVAMSVYPYAQVGRVGINTTAPAAMLHVKDSSVVFTYPFTLPATPGSPPVSGAGIRMMWYPEKAAFRAGRVSGTQWDKSKVGSNSVAMGYSTIASGGNSTAMGSSTTSSGLTSVAMGSSTTASGHAAVSMGGATVASGGNATVMGHITKANSYSSLVIGQLNDTTSISGTEWNLLDPVFAIGIGELPVRKNAMTVLKNGNTGIGIVSPQNLFHVSGGASGATPTSSAIGVFENSADASINIITPNANESGLFFGNPTNSVHGGIAYNSTVANGLAFRTNGNSTKMVINGVGDVGIGDNTPNARLHISDGTSGGIYFTNAEVIIEDNDASYLQFSAPTDEESGILSGNAFTSIRSALIFRADSSVQIRAGGNTPQLVITKNGDIGMGTPSPAYKLHLSTNSAGKPTSNVWTVASDTRLKKDVYNYEDGLEELLKINPMWFTYTGEADMPQETGVGVLAQELQQVAPYMIGTWNHTDDNGKTTPYLSVNNGPMTYMLINAVKEQQVMLNDQQRQIDLLLKELIEIKQKLEP